MRALSEPRDEVVNRACGEEKQQSRTGRVAQEKAREEQRRGVSAVDVVEGHHYGAIGGDGAQSAANSVELNEAERGARIATQRGAETLERGRDERGGDGVEGELFERADPRPEGRGAGELGGPADRDEGTVVAGEGGDSRREGALADARGTEQQRPGDHRPTRGVEGTRDALDGHFAAESLGLLDFHEVAVEVGRKIEPSENLLMEWQPSRQPGSWAFIGREAHEVDLGEAAHQGRGGGALGGDTVGAWNRLFGPGQHPPDFPLEQPVEKQRQSEQKAQPLDPRGRVQHDRGYLTGPLEPTEPCFHYALTLVIREHLRRRVALLDRARGHQHEQTVPFPLGLLRGQILRDRDPDAVDRRHFSNNRPTIG